MMQSEDHLVQADRGRTHQLKYFLGDVIPGLVTDGFSGERARCVLPVDSAGARESRVYMASVIRLR